MKSSVIFLLHKGVRTFVPPVVLEDLVLSHYVFDVATSIGQAVATFTNKKVGSVITIDPASPDAGFFTIDDTQLLAGPSYAAKDRIFVTFIETLASATGSPHSTDTNTMVSSSLVNVASTADLNILLFTGGGAGLIGKCVRMAPGVYSAFSISGKEYTVPQTVRFVADGPPSSVETLSWGIYGCSNIIIKGFNHTGGSIGYTVSSYFLTGNSEDIIAYDCDSNGPTTATVWTWRNTDRLTVIGGAYRDRGQGISGAGCTFTLLEDVTMSNMGNDSYIVTGSHHQTIRRVSATGYNPGSPSDHPDFIQITTNVGQFQSTDIVVEDCSMAYAAGATSRAQGINVNGAPNSTFNRIAIFDAFDNSFLLANCDTLTTQDLFCQGVVGQYSDAYKLIQGCDTVNLGPVDANSINYNVAPGQSSNVTITGTLTMIPQASSPTSDALFQAFLAAHPTIKRPVP